MTLPEDLYSAAQGRELDRIAIERHGIAGTVLMQRAGEAAFALLRAQWPRARRIAVVCGTGNNGGDGYVLARLARAAGLDPFVLTVGDTARIRGEAANAPSLARGPRLGPIGDAAAMRDACLAASVSEHAFDAGRLAAADVIVDALFGTGLERPVEGQWREAIEAMNRAGAPKLALDIPSGLHADTGAVMGAAVHADATMSFIGLKAGLFTGAGRARAGAIFFDDLGVPSQIYEDVTPAARRITESSLRGLIHRRARDAHKGDAGRVLIVGGNSGMPGAARLAGEAAYRAGAGLVTIATHPDHAAFLNATRPELIVHGIRFAKDLALLVARADVVAVGPGLGQDGWAQALFAVARELKKPLVVDADGLNLLAREPARREGWILTPHPGEAARMLGVAAAEIQADRFRAVREIASRFGGTCALKGSGTLVATEGREAADLCDAGNPGMASGGMGDVLTGVIAALCAQGLAAHDAARLGAWLHASAADLAAQEGGEIGLLASDLMPHLRKLIERLSI